MKPYRDRSILRFVALFVLVANIGLSSFGIGQELYEQKSPSTPFGKHSILTADTVELEFKMAPTKIDRIKGGGFNTDGERIFQEMGVGSSWKLGDASQMTHQFLVGVRQESYDNELPFGKEESQRFQQRQITSFNTRPSSKTKFSVSNEVVNERSSSSLRDTQLLKQTAALDYSMPYGITLRPEINHENYRSEIRQETERNSAYLTMKKDLVPRYLDLQLKPGIALEDQLYDGGQTSEAGRMDLSLSWKPDTSTQWIWGARAHQTDRLQELSQEQMKGLYSQISCSLWSDLAFRLRGDVNSTQKTFESGGLASDIYTMNLNFGPNMVLSESFSAGAELGFRHRYDHLSEQRTNEQTLSISLKGSF